MIETVRFCPACGAPVEWRQAYGRLRPVCPACGRVHFFDPKVAAAVLVEDAGRVLLVRRKSDPFRGTWTLPAGFVDAGEDPRLAAERECLEETGLQVRATRLLDVVPGLEHARGASIVIVYQAEITGGVLQASDDAEAAAFFSPGELPELGFEATRRVLAEWLRHSQAC